MGRRSVISVMVVLVYLVILFRDNLRPDHMLIATDTLAYMSKANLVRLYVFHPTDSFSYYLGLYWMPEPQTLLTALLMQGVAANGAYVITLSILLLIGYFGMLRFLWTKVRWPYCLYGSTLFVANPALYQLVFLGQVNLVYGYVALPWLLIALNALTSNATGWKRAVSWAGIFLLFCAGANPYDYLIWAIGLGGYLLYRMATIQHRIRVTIYSFVPLAILIAPALLIFRLFLLRTGASWVSGELGFPPFELHRYSYQNYLAALTATPPDYVISTLQLPSTIFWPSPVEALARIALFTLGFLAPLLARERKSGTFWSCLAIASLLLSTVPSGPIGGLYEWAFVNLPLIGAFRVAMRWLTLTYFAVAILVTVALTRIEKSVCVRIPSLRSRDIAKILLGGMFLTLLLLGNANFLAKGLTPTDIGVSLGPVLEYVPRDSIVYVLPSSVYTLLNQTRSINLSSVLLQYNGYRVFDPGMMRSLLHYTAEYNHTRKLPELFNLLGVSYAVYFKHLRSELDLAADREYAFLRGQDDTYIKYEDDNLAILEFGRGRSIGNGVQPLPHVSLLSGDFATLLYLMEDPKNELRSMAVVSLNDAYKSGSIMNVVTHADKFLLDEYGYTDLLAILADRSDPGSLVLLNRSVKPMATNPQSDFARTREADSLSQSLGEFFATTARKGASLVAPFALKSSGNFYLMIRYLAAVEGSRINLGIDGKSFNLNLTRSPQVYGKVAWYLLGPISAKAGNHAATFVHFGGLTILDAMFVVSESSLNAARSLAVQLMQHKEVEFALAPWASYSGIFDFQEMNYFPRRSVIASKEGKLELSTSIDVPMGGSYLVRVIGQTHNISYLSVRTPDGNSRNLTLYPAENPMDYQLILQSGSNSLTLSTFGAASIRGINLIRLDNTADLGETIKARGILIFKPYDPNWRFTIGGKDYLTVPALGLVNLILLDPRAPISMSDLNSSYDGDQYVYAFYAIVAAYASIAIMCEIYLRHRSRRFEIECEISA